MNRERVHRVWEAEGWQIWTRKKKRRAKGSSANNCAGLRAEYRGPVWGYDFVLDRTEQGGPLKFLAVLDEHTREAHEAAVLAEQFRVEYNLERPHSPWAISHQPGKPLAVPRGRHAHRAPTPRGPVQPRAATLSRRQLAPARLSLIRGIAA